VRFHESDMSEKEITDGSGQVVLEEQGPRVWPVQNYPNENVNLVSAEFASKQAAQHQNERILAQRHSIRVIPVSKVEYKFKGDDYEYMVYGQDHKIFHQDYPQSCMCCTCKGCVIL